MNDRVLVVDDDPTVHNLIAGLLRKFYDVVTAASGEEALTLAAQQPPAVVLLDIMMPGIDGCETCHRLKTEFTGENIQIIMVSAASSGEEQSRAFQAWRGRLHGQTVRSVCPMFRGPLTISLS